MNLVRAHMGNRSRLKKANAGNATSAVSGVPCAVYTPKAAMLTRMGPLWGETGRRRARLVKWEAFWQPRLPPYPSAQRGPVAIGMAMSRRSDPNIPISNHSLPCTPSLLCIPATWKTAVLSAESNCVLRI